MVICDGGGDGGGVVVGDGVVARDCVVLMDSVVVGDGVVVRDCVVIMDGDGVVVRDCVVLLDGIVVGDEVAPFPFLAPWTSCPPAIETPPHPVPTGPLIS